MPNTPIRNLSYTESVALFLDSADWLTEQHQILVTALELVAVRLDTRMSSTLVAELVKIVRLLMRDRQDQGSTDDVEAFLTNMGV